MEDPNDVDAQSCLRLSFFLSAFLLTFSGQVHRRIIYVHEAQPEPRPDSELGEEGYP